MCRRDIIVRMAKNDDGDAVAELMKKVGFFQWDNWAIDWHDLEPNWLVAEHDGVILGCIQVLSGRPIGRIEILAVEPELKLITKGYVVKQLTLEATAALAVMGSQVAAGTIPHRYEAYLETSKDYGWIEVEDAAIIMRRLS